MNHQKAINKQRTRRRNRVRNRVQGTAEQPRLSIFRSCKHIYAQLIDDENGVTIASASSRAKDFGGAYGGNKDAAAKVGKALAESAKTKGIETIAFDRGHYKYHGRVKALADGAREGGLKF